jgi:4-amino-4-deoxy-L-arabinose transferase-like glycosyltransferase
LQAGNQWRHGLTLSAFILIIVLQCLFSLAGIANLWQLGHNGYNGAAYQQGARNALRFGLLFPAQYHCDRSKEPKTEKLYTHAPLALHAHIVACISLLGDSEWSVRLTPALYGVAALIAFLVIVKRRWGDLHALVAGAVYVLLPINHSYANMVNHSTGFIFWSLLTLEAYLNWIEATSEAVDSPEGAKRERAWLVALFVSAFFAMQWDWPAYYVMFAIAVHWFFLGIDRKRKRDGRYRLFNREHRWLALFCLFVLVLFFGFFALVYHVAGGLNDLFASANSRAASEGRIYEQLWTQTIKPDFSVPVLICGAAWITGTVLRLFRKETRARDLIPIAFLFAGVTHVLIFKTTALIHAYWPWPLNPFFAIATASVLLWAAGLLASLARTAMARLALLKGNAGALTAIDGACVVLCLGSFSIGYLAHTLPLIEQGRRNGGAYRDASYDTGVDLILFAKAVRDNTAPDTVVRVPNSLGYQVQMNVTLDRTWRRAKNLERPKKKDSCPSGCVLIGAGDDAAPEELARAAAAYRYVQYGGYYMVDFRKPGKDIRVYRWEKTPATLGWKFFVSPFEPPRRPVRDREAEHRLSLNTS